MPLTFQKRKNNEFNFNNTLLNNSHSLEFFIDQHFLIYESIGGLPLATLATIPQIQFDLTFKQLIGLGQNTFGEVYEGISNVDKVEITVVVKTLLPTAIQDGIENYIYIIRFYHELI